MALTINFLFHRLTENQSVICILQVSDFHHVVTSSLKAHNPPFTPLVGCIKLLIPSTAKMNRKGERGSSCLNPLCEENNPFIVLFTKIENLTVLIQCLNHLTNLAPKLMFSSIKKIPI